MRKYTDKLFERASIGAGNRGHFCVESEHVLEQLLGDPLCSKMLRAASKERKAKIIPNIIKSLNLSLCNMNLLSDAFFKTTRTEQEAPFQVESSPEFDRIASSARMFFAYYDQPQVSPQIAVLMAVVENPRSGASVLLRNNGITQNQVHHVMRQSPMDYANRLSLPPSKPENPSI